MVARGQKPQGKVALEWSGDFAYAIGLIASDGCLSKDGRHVDLTSKDEEQLINFMKCLGISLKVGVKKGVKEINYLRIQIGDVRFYNFLLGIGFTKAKSLTLGPIDVPKEYFFDFLRGVFDGDGCSYSYFDKRWPSSFMLYTTFASSSRSFIDWIQDSIYMRLGIKGHITIAHLKNPYYQLKYAKKDSLVLIPKMFPSTPHTCLSRKKLKLNADLAMIEQLRNEVLTD